MPQYGVLLSSHSESNGARIYPHKTYAQAANYGYEVVAAQPGLEFQMMVRNAANEPWESPDGESITEVIRRRWSGEQAHSDSVSGADKR